MRVNYKNSAYKFRFSREPKDWSIEKLHQLYLDAVSRSNKKRKIVLSILDRIEKELPDAGVYLNVKTRVLYKQENDEIYKRVLSYQKEYQSWGVRSWEKVLFGGTVSENREEKLNLLLSSQKQFELGSLYDKYDRDNLYLHRIPWEALCEKVENKLREKFKSQVAPEFFTIQIDDKNYIVNCDDKNRYNKFYKNFSLKSEVVHVEL
jgi:hypothetical protein